MCGKCGKPNKNWLCNKCKKELKKYFNMQIDKYGQPKNFDEHIYLFKYEATIREEIIKYKFQEKSYKYKMLTKIILSEKNTCDKIEEYDIILPVPISKERKKQRGYNQSELIAREISKNLKIEYEKNALKKQKNTVAQSLLNKEQREENARGAYTLKNAKKIQNKKILLLDDIFTTGSTVGECCRILRSANPQKIGVLTIAKD